jgi:hypothetical protein
MQENALATTSDLFNACSVLFGSDVSINIAFLKYLQTSGLKAAYRKKAFETHPDRAAALAEPALSLEERFKEVNNAYEQLSSFIEYPWKYSLNVDTSVFNGNTSHLRKNKKYHASREDANAYKGNSGTASRRAGEFFWQGDIPRQKLMLGRYLFYSGIISSRTLIDAIVWQKRLRPLVGSIATRWDWLAKDEIRAILSRRRPGEKFGECALRCGYISPYQLSLLLGRQRMLQPRIGNFFIDRRIINAKQMEIFVEKLRAHNWKNWRS